MWGTLAHDQALHLLKDPRYAGPIGKAQIWGKTPAPAMTTGAKDA